ncbi:hypothetical protein GCM10023238_27860 [Streptomyces heliomycini]
MLAVHTPDALRRAVSTGDEKALTAVPGIGKKGAQKLLLELKGPPRRAARRPRRRRTGHQRLARPAARRLIASGTSTREADEAVSAVRPSEAAGGAPQVGQLLKAALQTLNRAR